MAQQKEIRIVAINSSLRGTKGVSRYVIDRILSGARECGAKCEVVDLSEHKIKRCVGCRTCQTPEHQNKCIFCGSDDVEAIFKKIRAADVVIYATPVYIFTISSLLKTLLERTFYTARSDDIEITDSGLFFHNIDTSVSRKPFVALILCDNMETLTPMNAISYFKTYSRFTGSENLGILVRRSARLFREGSSNPKQQNIITNIDAAYAQAGREIVSAGRISPKTLATANQNIIRVPKAVKLLLRFRFFRNSAKVRDRIETERHRFSMSQ